MFRHTQPPKKIPPPSGSPHADSEAPVSSLLPEVFDSGTTLLAAPCRKCDVPSLGTHSTGESTRLHRNGPLTAVSRHHPRAPLPDGISLPTAEPGHACLPNHPHCCGCSANGACPPRVGAKLGKGHYQLAVHCARRQAQTPTPLSLPILIWFSTSTALASSHVLLGPASSGTSSSLMARPVYDSDLAQLVFAFTDGISAHSAWCQVGIFEVAVVFEKLLDINFDFAIIGRAIAS